MFNTPKNAFHPNKWYTWDIQTYIKNGVANAHATDGTAFLLIPNRFHIAFLSYIIFVRKKVILEKKKYALLRTSNMVP